MPGFRPIAFPRGRCLFGIMNIISRRAHGVLDYMMGAILILSPVVLGLEGAARTVPMILGLSGVLYSLCTNYELGLFKLIPFRAHLGLDLLSGLLLALSPWLFGFAERVWVPHVILGLVEVGAVVMTRTVASEDRPMPVVRP